MGSCQASINFLNKNVVSRAHACLITRFITMCNMVLPAIHQTKCGGREQFPRVQPQLAHPSMTAIEVRSSHGPATSAQQKSKRVSALHLHHRPISSCNLAIHAAMFGELVLTSNIQTKNFGGSTACSYQRSGHMEPNVIVREFSGSFQKRCAKRHAQKRIVCLMNLVQK